MIHYLSTIFLFFFGLFGVACAEQKKAPAVHWQMPSQSDVIHLNWLKGPPQLQAFNPIDKHLAGFREADALLGFRSEQWGMILDPRSMELSHLTLEKSSDAVTELLDFEGIQTHWSPGQLLMTATIGGNEYRPVGGPLPSLAEDYSYSPIHIVESGDWFQHVAIYDLDLIDADGNKCAGKSWLEIRAWGDRCLFEWFVEPEVGEPSQLSIQLLHGSQDTQSAQFSGRRVQLGVDFSSLSMQPIILEEPLVRIEALSKDSFTLGQPEVRYSSVSDAWELRIPKQEWPSTDVTAYSADLLDRISRFDLKLENSSDEAREVSLRFMHDYHPVTGYVPMLLDSAGQQTGLPIQNSKNWHDFRPEPYDNTWIHLTTRLTLDPRSTVNLEYIVAHAQWQGVPASSAAQLSLIGWGYNGFWTQMALGSWGETVCLQPGRSMRRAFITDVRPYQVIGRNGLPYDWTSNVGGADIGKVVDDEGKLITWQGTVREFGMIGPNLSHVRVSERSAQNRMRLQIDSYLPRSNSINRSYYKVRLEALEDIAFNELSLFQLGNDYYNEMESTKVAWGDLDGRVGEASPDAAEWGRVMEPVRLPSGPSWVSLFANAPEPKARGRAVRGLVIRDFRAELAGKVYDAPWLASARTMKRLNAELVLPPEIRQLKAGDTVEFTVEMAIFPFNAEAYYGGDDSLRERLQATPDSWELTAYEAAHQQVHLNGVPQVFPASYTSTRAVRQNLTIRSRSRMDTVLVTGLPHPDTWGISERFEGQLVPLGKRFSVEAEPQISYQPESQTWTAVLSLVFPEGGGTRYLELNFDE